VTVRVVRAGDGYGGMDRPPLGSSGDVPAALVERGIALEAGAEPERWRAFLAELAGAGAAGYEVLRLGGEPGPGWELLGHDVGETTPAAWSAIRHRDDFLGAEQSAAWAGRLNARELFDRREDAEAFLAAYLAADDPDRGWGPEGWTDEPGIYAVVPVYRLT
jgi:hypothetical protein